MTIEPSAPTHGNLFDHISTPPALPICFDSSDTVDRHPRLSPLDFVVGINALAWGQCNEIYPQPREEEILAEWDSVTHNVPAILAKWQNYGIFGTNIEGWFPLEIRNTDYILRAIALFGFVLWVDKKHPSLPQVRVLCGFHRNLGVSIFGKVCGVDFKELSNPLDEFYVVIPTIYAETDHPSTNYIHYDTLETN